MPNSDLTVCVSAQPSAAYEQSVPCPLCGGTAHRQLAACKQQSLRLCQGCGVRFLDPQPSAAELLDRFADWSTAKRSDPERNRRKVLSSVARYIQGKKSAGTIVDVGCATGFFLGNFFHPHLAAWSPRSSWRKLGVEISSSYAERAEERGMQVFRGTIHEAPIGERSVDVITMLDAFYYFRQPQLELAKFRTILKDDGLLVLEMPVAASRLLRLSGTGGRWLSDVRGSIFEESDHLFYYTPDSISRLLAQNGFRVKEIVMLPANRQDNWLREIFYQFYALVSRVLRSITGSRIFLGPRFLVAAAKCRTTVVQIAGPKCEKPS